MIDKERVRRIFDTGEGTCWVCGGDIQPFQRIAVQPVKIEGANAGIIGAHDKCAGDVPESPLICQRTYWTKYSATGDRITKIYQRLNSGHAAVCADCGGIISSSQKVAVWPYSPSTATHSDTCFQRRIIRIQRDEVQKAISGTMQWNKRAGGIVVGRDFITHHLSRNVAEAEKIIDAKTKARAEMYCAGCHEPIFSEYKCAIRIFPGSLSAALISPFHRQCIPGDYSIAHFHHQLRTYSAVYVPMNETYRFYKQMESMISKPELFTTTLLNIMQWIRDWLQQVTDDLEGAKRDYNAKDVKNALFRLQQASETLAKVIIVRTDEGKPEETGKDDPLLLRNLPSVKKFNHIWYTNWLKRRMTRPEVVAHIHSKGISDDDITWFHGLVSTPWDPKTIKMNIGKTATKMREMVQTLYPSFVDKTIDENFVTTTLKLYLMMIGILLAPFESSTRYPPLSNRELHNERVAMVTPHVPSIIQLLEEMLAVLKSTI